jgi:hypothetical protein
VFMEQVDLRLDQRRIQRLVGNWTPRIAVHLTIS